MNFTHPSFSITLSFLMLLFGSSAYADLIMSAPPRESPDAGRQLYEPIAAHISTITGQKVVYDIRRAG